MARNYLCRCGGMWPEQTRMSRVRAPLVVWVAAGLILRACAGLMTMVCLHFALAPIWLGTVSPLLHRNCNRHSRRSGFVHESVQTLHCHGGTAKAWDSGITSPAIGYGGIIDCHCASSFRTGIWDELHRHMGRAFGGLGCACMLPLPSEHP